MRWEMRLSVPCHYTGDDVYTKRVYAITKVSELMICLFSRWQEIQIEFINNY